MPIIPAPSIAPFPAIPFPSAVAGIKERIAPLVPAIVARRIMNLAPLGTPFSNSFSRTFVKSSNSFCVGSFLSSVLINPSGNSSPNISFNPLFTPVSYTASSNSLYIPVAGSNILNLVTVGPGNAFLNKDARPPVLEPMPNAALKEPPSKNCTPSFSFIAASNASLIYVPNPFWYPRSPTILFIA